MNLMPVGRKSWKFHDKSEDELRQLKSVSAETLVRKLRWATVGVQFDWSKVFRAISVSLVLFVGLIWVGCASECACEYFVFIFGER